MAKICHFMDNDKQQRMSRGTRHIKDDFVIFLCQVMAQEYGLPTSKLLPFDPESDKDPLVIIACGSYSPVTYLHLRMFEMARDRIRESPRYYCIGGYFSPTSDGYKKPGLASAKHRLAMCSLAVETSDWIMVDPWEASHQEWHRTVLVLKHFDEHLNEIPRKKDAARPNIRIMLLAGGDLIESFGTPLLWSTEDLCSILENYGCLIVERTGVDVKLFLLEHDVLHKFRHNILIAKQYIHNDINSTKIRLFIRRGMSVKYLLPDAVIDYIRDNNLYTKPDTS